MKSKIKIGIKLNGTFLKVQVLKSEEKEVNRKYLDRHWCNNYSIESKLYVLTLVDFRLSKRKQIVEIAFFSFRILKRNKNELG